ncbi:MAG: hypothetical protein NXI24_21080 [bacterium]|nr:hypothetical protein [bacterium]
MQAFNYRNVVLTGLIGILAATMVGVGEGFLHFSDSGNYADDGRYEYLLEVPGWRLTWGHFLAVFGTPLYLVGFWHIYLGTRPFGTRLPFATFLLAAYGFIMGAVWISSRVSIALLVQANREAGGDDAALLALIQHYIANYESLLWVIRVTTGLTSLAFIGMVLSNRTLYPRWMAIFNPIVLLISAFVLFVVAPDVGKYTLPIALNAGYFVFFVLSTIVLSRVCEAEAS